MKDRDFQDRIVVGRAVLPGYDFPIAKIEKHLYLAPGNYLNLYPGPPFEPIKGDVSLWLETMQKVFLPWQWELLEQFFGAVIQKTFKYLLKLTPEQSREMGEESKIQFGPLIVGPEGTLKKGLSRTIERIIGSEHCDINATFDQMIEKHSEVILNQLMVFINEVVTTGEVTKKTEISNKLKPFWTDERTKINPKNIRPFKYWNNCNGTMFSNEKDCLHIGKSARRYMVIHQDLSVKDLQKLNDDGTFRRFYEFINSDKIAHVFHYFLYEVKIKDWRIWNGGRAPATPDLKTMQDGSDHPIASKLQRALDARTEPFDTRFVGFASIDSIMDYARERWKMPTINEKYIINWIKENAIPWKNGNLEKQIVHAELGRPRVYKFINYQILDELSQSQLGNLYKFDYFDLQKLLHGFTVTNRPFDDVFSTDAKQKERRAQYVKELIEFYLAPGGSPYVAQIKIAEILLTLIKADKDYNKAIRDSKEEGIIGEKKINYEKLAEQVIEIANNKVKNLTKQMLDEK